MPKHSIYILKNSPLELVSIDANADMFYGNPYGAAMDCHSATVANLILKQKASLSVIECTLKAVKLHFNCDLQLAITGADMRWKLDDNPLTLYKTIQVKKGQVLSGGYAAHGLRSYIAFDRLIKLKAGNEISLGKRNKAKELETEGIYELKIDNEIPIFRGPEWNLLNQEGKSIMIDFNGNIGQDIDRMGAFLNGPNITLKAAFPTQSVCTFPGVIQLLPSGQLIVLLQDAQTTGGYPRIAYLDRDALDQFNQLMPGQKIRWKLIL